MVTTSAPPIGGGMRVALLGELVVTRDGRQVEVPAGARRSLLVLLALEAPRAIGRARLIDAVWGDDPPSAAVNALQVHVSALRRVLGSDAVATVGDGYRLAGDVAVDAKEFEAAVRRGQTELDQGLHERAAQTLRFALELWRGPALGDAGDASFVPQEASRLEEARLNAIEARINADMACGLAGDLVPELEALVREHPYREGLLGRLMQALYRSGRQAEALAAFEEGRTRLLEELGLTPSAPLRDLQLRILEQSEPTPTRNNYRFDAPLPAMLDATIGRDRELAAMIEMLRRSDARLVSVVGPGGVGKTRLAIELAHRIDGFRDGVVFVPVAAATRPDDVATSLCAALGLLVTDDVETTLERALATRESVVICDNFEHVLPAASLLVKLLAAGPALRIVVTSRQLLGVRGERPFPLAPLGFEEGGQAAELFLARVREADRSFVPTDQDWLDAAVIAEKCDGLPLALELAAGRTRVLTVGELRTSLGDPLGLAAVGVHDRPDRHATMRGNIAWSVDVLPPAQADFLRALTVFHGGFTAEAAAAVAGVGVDTAVAEIAELCDRSLVQRAAPAAGRRRFDLLVTVRDYVAESLGPGALRVLRDRHAEHIRCFLNPPPDPGVSSERVEVWLARLAERANIREAVRHALRGSDSALAADLVVAAASIWYHSGSRPDLTSWLNSILDLPDVSPSRRCDALIWIALLWGDDDPSGQVATLEEALALADRAGDDRRRGYALWQLAQSFRRQHRVDEGQRFAREALSLARSTGSAVLEASVLSAVGILSIEDLGVALPYFQESVRVARQHHLDLRLSVLLNNLAEVHLLRGEPALARECATEGLELAVRAQSSLGLADHLGQRGTASLLLGNPDDAARDLGDAVRTLLRLGQTYFALHCLERYAAAVSPRRPDIASIALAVVDASPEFEPEGLSAGLRDRFVADLPARVGADGYAEVHGRGRELVADLGTLGAIATVMDHAARADLP